MAKPPLPPAKERCEHCGGTGSVLRYISPMHGAEPAHCRNCLGTGRFDQRGAPRALPKR